MPRATVERNPAVDWSITVPGDSAAPEPPVPLMANTTDPSSLDWAASLAHASTGMPSLGTWSRARSWAGSQLTSVAVSWVDPLTSVMADPGATAAAATVVYDVSMRLVPFPLCTAKAVPTDGLPVLSSVATAYTDGEKLAASWGTWVCGLDPAQGRGRGRDLGQRPSCAGRRCSTRPTDERASKSWVSERSWLTWLLKLAHQNAPLAPKARPVRAKISSHSSTERVKIGKRTELRAA